MVMFRFFGQIDIIENGCHIIQYLVLKQEQINLLTENINNMFAILLSTYNGEKFIKEQINSLLTQTFTSFVLYIRDDGSSDNTPNILDEYALKYDNIIILNDAERRRGACNSFLWLLKEVEADYYMFCDQDDVWLPNKVQISFDAFKEEEMRSSEKPILIHTDLIITDANLNIKAPSLWKHDKTDPYIITRKYLKLVNYITGCTMLFNKRARDLAIEDNKFALMHDFWVGISVDSVNGVIISLPIPTILYRQHANNTIGASKKEKRYLLERYLHFPDFNYSNRLYRMLNSRYNIGILRYILLRFRFYLSK